MMPVISRAWASSVHEAGAWRSALTGPSPLGSARGALVDGSAAALALVLCRLLLAAAAEGSAGRGCVVLGMQLTLARSFINRGTKKPSRRHRCINQRRRRGLRLDFLKSVLFRWSELDPGGKKRSLQRIIFEMDHPVCLIAGSPGSGKSTIIAQILAASGGLIASEAEPCEGSIWSVNTKYYSARVHLHEHALTPHAEQPPCVRPEALVLVVDCQHATSFDVARAWAEREGELSGSAEVKLLIASKADQLMQQPRVPGGTLARPPWLIEAIDWCSEAGYEYIEVCPGAAGTVPGLDAALELDGDPQGLPRVVEALQSHAWPGMALKAVRGGGAQVREAAGGVGAPGSGEVAASASAGEGGELAGASGAATGGGPLPHPPSSSRGEATSAAAPGAQPLTSSGDGALKAPGLLPGERGIEDFEKLFLEMQGVC